MRARCVPVLMVAAFSLVLTPLAAALAANVTAQDKGASALLDNGIVSVEINKQNGNVLALNYHKTKLLAERPARAFTGSIRSGT